MERKRGFTLIELVVVIIIVGILATLGLTQYTKVVERGRSAEAKSILGSLRSAEVAYKLDHTTYAAVADLPIEAPAACATTHFFSYSCATATGLCTAARCTAGGKTPDVTTTYNITLDITGTWGGTAGYY